MAVIGTFGSFTAARLGIYAAQSSLNVTGNNIANINTKGYTRQRMDLVSIHSAGSARYANSYNLDIGYGVLADSVSQLRDPFMDIRYRNERSKVGASETWLKNLQQLSHTLDEVGAGDDFGIVERQFNDFLSQLQQLNGAVGTVEYDTTVRSSAQVLCNLFNSYSTALETVADNQLKNLKDDVVTVNSLLTRIRDLNAEIREAGIYHNNALELRDERNVLIDELSTYMQIDVRYSMEPLDEFSEVEKLSISIANTGNPPIELINGIYGGQIEMPEKLAKRNPEYNFENRNAPANKDKKPYLDKDGNEIDAKDIKDEDLVDNAVAGSDKNRLWMSVTPLIRENGDVLKDNNGQDYKTVPLGDNTIYGGLQSMREFITEKGEFSSVEDLKFDKDAASKRGVPYYRKALDALAQKFAEMFNEANQFNFDQMESAYEVDGGNFKGTGVGSTYFADADKQIKDWEEELAEATDPAERQTLRDNIAKTKKEAYEKMEEVRQKGTLTEGYSYYNGGVLFSSSGDKDDPTNINAKNITISKSWSTGEVRILNTKEAEGPALDANGNPIRDDEGNLIMISHTTANDNVAHMINLMGQKFDYLPREIAPDASNEKRYFSGTFQERLADINVILAVDQETTTTLYNSYSIKSLSLENDRQSVSGVDLNDEATNMMVFQKSYSAACQLMTTLDSMLDKLINGTIR